MTETLAYGYSSESTQRELSNEYQHDRVWMFFEKLCVLVLWVKVSSALEWLRQISLAWISQVTVHVNTTYIQKYRVATRQYEYIMYEFMNTFIHKLK